MTSTKRIFILYTCLIFSWAGIDVQAQTFYTAEATVVTNAEQIHVEVQEDARLQTQGILYTTADTQITDNNKQVYAQVLEIPSFESELQRQVSQIKHRRAKSTSTTQEDNLAEQASRFLVFRSYSNNLPFHYEQAYYAAKSISTSTTSLPTNLKAVKINNKPIQLLVYKYSNTALYNKQLAQRPVSSYTALLAHRITNLPPPGPQPP